VIFKRARRTEPPTAAARALLYLHVVVLDLVGREFVQLGWLAKRARMLAMPLRPPILLLGFWLGLAVRLRLVSLSPQPLHFGLQLRDPRIALGELLLQLRHPPQQGGHLLSKCCDIFHDAHNVPKISVQAKSNLA